MGIMHSTTWNQLTMYRPYVRDRHLAIYIDYYYSHRHGHLLDHVPNPDMQ